MSGGTTLGDTAYDATLDDDAFDAQYRAGGPALLGPTLQAELRSAVRRVERRAYAEGWWYGLLCGVLAGASALGLGYALLHTVADAWGR